MTKTAGMNSRKKYVYVLLFEVIAFGMIAVAASCHFLLWDAVKIVMSMVVAYSTPRIVLSRSKSASLPVRVTFAVLGMLLVALSVYKIWACTAGCGKTFALPGLQSDANSYFRWALHHYDGSCPPPKTVHFFGLPVMILITWVLLGQNITWAFAVNLMFTLLSVVLFGMMGVRLLRGRVKAGRSVVMLWVMLISCFWGFYYSQGLAIQKEAMNYFGIATVGYVMAGMSNGKNNPNLHLWKESLLFIAGCLVLIFTRANMAYFVLAGLALVVIDNRRVWCWCAFLATVVVVISYFGMYVFAREAQIDHQLRVVAGMWRGGDMTTLLFVNGSNQEPLKRILGDYFHYSVMHKVALLPVTATAQYLIPFPWIASGPATLDMVMCRFTYTWYLVGGVCLFYYAAFSWRKREGLGAVAFWPVIAYLATAYATGGSLARYMLPFHPVCAILAVCVLLRLREGKKWRKAFVLWGVCYVVMLIVTLVICYNLQIPYIKAT